MKPKLDVKGVLNRAKKKKRRQKVSFTFDAELYKSFIAICSKQDVAISRLLEELMRDFVENS